MRKKHMLDVRELNEIERKVYLYSCSYRKDGLLLTNNQIAENVGISVDYLLDVLDDINDKMNGFEHYSD